MSFISKIKIQNKHNTFQKSRSERDYRVLEIKIQNRIQKSKSHFQKKSPIQKFCFGKKNLETYSKKGGVKCIFICTPICLRAFSSFHTEIGSNNILPEVIVLNYSMLLSPIHE